MYSDTGDTTSLAPGFPIRTSSDPRSVDSSPRHNAASHVLHRLPVPRHPPCALKHLQTQNQKMSHPHTPKGACGHQKNCTSDTKQPTTTHAVVSTRLLPRCSQPLSTNQTPHTTTKPTTGAAHPTNLLSHRTPTRCGRAQVSWCSLERR